MVRGLTRVSGVKIWLNELIELMDDELMLSDARAIKRESVLLDEAVSRSMFVIELIGIKTLQQWRNG